MVKKIDLYNRIKFDDKTSTFYVDKCFENRIHRYVLHENSKMYWYVRAVMNMSYRNIKKAYILRCFHIIELCGTLYKIDI